MSITRCLSSQMMSGLLAWRNPQGKEEGWMRRPQGIDNLWEHRGKVVSTEIGLGIITITSIIETVAYATLATGSLALNPITHRPYTFFAKLLQSSSFTIIWAAADALIYNPLFLNVMTRESFARCWADMFNPTSIELFRLEDRLYAANWEQQHRHQNANNDMLRPIRASGLATQKNIDAGATFITEHVLSGASNDTLTRFKDTDPTIYMFILTKAVYIYAAGSKKDDDVPDFFNVATKKLILTLRPELNDEVVLGQLQELITDPDTFDITPPNEATKSAFNKLKNIAFGEFRGLFITGCWEQAKK